MTDQAAPNAVARPDATQLAVERTLLADERTLMARIRTATSLISIGFTICKFFQFSVKKGRAASAVTRRDNSAGPCELEV